MAPLTAERCQRVDVEITSSESSALQLVAPLETDRSPGARRAPMGAGSGTTTTRASSEPDETGPSLRDRLRAVLSPPIDSLLPVEGSILDWPGDLLPFQLDGVRVLVSRPEVLLADDMGLGKTIQAIAALRILFHERAIESALVVVPDSLVYQWRGEIKRWAPSFE